MKKKSKSILSNFHAHQFFLSAHTSKIVHQNKIKTR